jgi:predicted peroxiredoxin
VHARIEGKKDYERYYFYDNLEKVYDECPRSDIKIYLCDFNAKVGKEQDAKPSTGKNSSHADSLKFSICIKIFILA